MKRWPIPLLLLLFLALTACAASYSTDSSQQLQLFFASTETHGPAISGEPYTGPADPSAEDLLKSLLAGPSSDQLRSPFPSGLSLRKTALEEGHLIVDFSEPYGGLTDISLTLADYCVVLTVCQLDGIDSVEITVSGRSMTYRSHQVLTPEEVMLNVQSTS